MNYVLEDATPQDVPLLENYKLKTIMQDANDLTEEEINKIKEYVQSHIPKQIKAYKLIKLENKIIGCVLVTSYQQGVFLDELFIEKEYRNNGIGSSIVKKVLADNDIVYLWAYKKNRLAIDLYKKLGFIIDDETKHRYFMKYSR